MSNGTEAQGGVTPIRQEYKTEEDFANAAIPWLRRWSGDFAPSAHVEEAILLICDLAARVYAKAQANEAKPFKQGDVVHVKNIAGPMMIVQGLENSENTGKVWVVYLAYFTRRGEFQQVAMEAALVEKVASHE